MPNPNPLAGTQHTIHGTPAADTIVFTAAHTTVNAGEGANTITGTSGHNLINSGAGVDTIAVTSGDNTIQAGAGANTITATTGDNAITTGDGADTITVTSGDNTILAGDGANTIVATSGVNTITTGSGADTITTGGVAGGGNTINAGDGANTVTTGAGDDTVTGGNGVDTITTGAGDDVVYGGNGANTITTGAGNDIVFSGVDIDTLTTGAGNDEINITGGTDTIAAGAGTDTLIADFSLATGAVSINGLAGTVAAGYAGNISGLGIATFAGVENFDITSGDFNDTITTGDGTDVVHAGAGSDTVNLAGGNDEAIYTMAANTGASDAYQGGSGVDTLTLELTTAEWFSAAVQTDIANYLAFQAAHTDPITGEADSAVFQFTAFDLSASEFEALNVLVDGVMLDPNDAAVTAVADTATVNEDDTATLFGSVLGNDIVPDLAKSVSLISTTSSGSLTFNAGAVGAPEGTFSFDPLNDFDYLADGESTPVSFVYEVEDADGDTNQATVTITVTGTNDVPTVGAAVANTTNEDAAAYSVDLLDGASDVDTTDVLNVANLTVVSGDASGITLSGNALSVNPSAYTALAVGTSEIVTYSYDIVDGNGGSVAQTASVTINGVNDAPTVAAALAKTTYEDDDAFSIDLLADAADVDNGETATLSVQNVTGLVDGITLNGNTLDVNPADAAFQYLGVGDSEVITVSYDVEDAQGAIVPQTATITVNGTNDAPEFSTSVSSVVAFADTIEASSGFVFSAGWGFQSYGTASYGYSSVGQELHVNNVNSAFSGTAVLGIPGITAPGTYTVNVDVGNYNNIGLATISAVGLQSAGVFLAVTQSTIPSPASGQKETWVLTYDVSQADIDAGLSFGIAVPATGVWANASFDNLIITTEVSSVDGVVVGSITELADNAPGEATANLSTDGTIAFTEVDLTDIHTVSVAANGAGYLGALTAVVSDDATGDGTGAVTWTFEINDGAVDYLAEGETLTQSYDVTVDDGEGGLDTETVTITVNGTNDAPIIDVATSDLTGGVVETADVADVVVPPVTAPPGLVFTNTDNITLANAQVETGSDASNNPEVVNGATGTLLTYTAGGSFGSFPAGGRYGSHNLNDGDIGATPTNQDGFYAIPNVGVGSLTLNLDGMTTISSIAINNGYGNRTDGAYELTDGAGNVLGGWAISGTPGATNNGVHSFWLTFDTPVNTDMLVLNTTSTEGSNTNSYREIQIFGEPALTDSGVIDFADVDLTDGHSVDPVIVASVGALGALTASVTSAATGGAVGKITWEYSVAPGLVDYLAEGETKFETFEVTVVDDFGATDTQVVTVTVTGTNDAPVITSNAVEASGAVTEAGNDDAGAIVAGVPSATGTLSSDDVDTGASAAWSGDATDTYGSFAIDAVTGVWTYTLDNTNTDTNALDEGQVETETFTVTVTDEFDATDTQDVTVTVAGTNDSPIALDDTLASGPADAANWTYNPDNGHYYRLVDQGSTFAQAISGSDALGGYLATVTTPSEQAFIEANGLIGQSSDAMWIGGQANFGSQGSSAPWTWITGPEAGQQFSYANWNSGEPNGAFSGTNQYAQVYSPTHTFPGFWNDAPDSLLPGNGQADSYLVEWGGRPGDTGFDEDTVLTIDAATLLANDTDVDTGAILSVTAVSAQSAVGAPVSLSGTDITYDPTVVFNHLAAGETATDTFTYVVTDEFGATDTATVTLTVQGQNDAPVVTAIDAGSVTEDDAIVSIDLLVGQTDVDNGQTLSVDNIVATDDLGAIVAFTNNGNGTISVDPTQYDALNDNENRTVTVNYDVFDGIVNVANTATLVVEGVNDNEAPVAVADTLASTAVTGTVVNYIEDFEGGVTGWSNNNTSTDYTPDPLAFTEVLGRFAGAGQGAVQTTIAGVGPGTVTIGFNFLELYSWDGELFKVWADGVEVVSDQFYVDGHYGNADGDSKPFATSISNTLPPFLGEFSSQPYPTELWHYEFTFEVTGPDLVLSFGSTLNQALSDEAWAIDNLSVTSNLPATGTVAGNDSDPDTGAVLSFSLDAPVVGLSMDSNGNYSFDVTDAAYASLPAGEEQIVVANYTVQDEFGATDQSTLTITVTGTNDAPVAVADVAAVSEDGPGIIIDLLGNDGDVDLSDILAIDSFDFTGTDGIVTNNGDGTVTYDPNGAFEALNAGDTATDSFAYTVSDGNGGTDIATVDVTINGEDDAVGTFDDITTDDFVSVPNGYLGVNWSGFTLLNATNYSIQDSGYIRGNTSPDYVVFTSGTGTVSGVSGDEFDFASTTLTAAWNDNLNINIDGYRDGVLIYDTTVIVSDDGPTVFTFNWDDVDVVTFTPYGGTDAGTPGGGIHLAMDDISFA